MAVLSFFIVYFICLTLSCYLLFPKLDLASWRGLVPVLRWMDIAEKVGRKPWYGILTIIPILNIFIVTGLAVALVRSFNKLSLSEAALAVIFAPISFYKLAKNDQDKYEGPILTREAEYLMSMKEAKDLGHDKKLQKLSTTNPYKKSAIREWFESIVFAVFAAAFIRMFFIEAYVIPTPSMEGSLLVGDFLFVSKMTYGIRPPQTVAMVPLLHNRIPILGTESYLKKPSLPYFRFGGGSEITRNEPFVFNWPVGDSVYITSRRSYTVSQVAREPEAVNGDLELAKKVDTKDYVVRPNDKKDHYIKRCVAVAGDSLQVIETQLYINGKPANNPEHMQFQYILAGTLDGVNPKKLEEWGVDQGDEWRVGQTSGFFLDNEQYRKITEASPYAQLIKVPNQASGDRLFPHDAEKYGNWTVDNYGPIWIPKKGASTPLNLDNLPFYSRIIDTYENNELEVKAGKIFINGAEVSSYTFKQDYFWAMGDNRHNSEDSRMWGYVPFDHVVGRPLIIWFSTKNGSMSNGIRWDRIFKSASNL